MAIRRRKRKKTSVKDIGSPLAEQRDELQRWVAHVRDNLVLYAASALFIVACAFAGMWFSVSRSDADRSFATKYAAALEKEKPEEQLAALEPLAGEKNRLTPEVLYMIGETAIRASAYDKAESAFKRVTEEYAASDYAPQAAEGLAFLAENKGDLDGALASYQKVLEKWPNSFIGRRQPFNIARVLEAKGDIKGAIDSYRNQVNLFPDSKVAGNAQKELDRLKESNPLLFPAEESPKPDDAAADKPADAAAPAADKPAAQQ